MIGFLPELYEDELCYSWFARYYTHSGYDAYVYAREDLFERKNIRPDILMLNRLNQETKRVIEKQISMEELILNHTMFPLYRFTENERLRNAFAGMLEQKGNPDNMLPIPKYREPKCLRYCPACVEEDRKRYGETFWHRSWMIFPMCICVKHRCGLVETDIVIKEQHAPRLITAEEIVREDEGKSEPNTFLKSENVEELQFAAYLQELFYAPFSLNNNIPVSEFLKSKLERTKYLSTRGRMRNISLLTQDFTAYFQNFQYAGMTELQQLQKCFTGHRWNFYELGQLGYFLKISAGEMTSPKLPKTSQTERFNSKVAELYEAGYGCYRIARIVNASPTTVRKANRTRQAKQHDYDVRKGCTRKDWDRIDTELLPQIREVCKAIYSGNGSRPRRVTQFAVERQLGLPGKQLDYLPQSKKAVQDYYESHEEYWAREMMWAYRKLTSESIVPINMRRIREITNINHRNMLRAIPYLKEHGTAKEVQEITELIQP